MRGWILASRPLFLPGALALYAAGALLAGGPWLPGPLGVGAAVVVLVHLVTHYINDVDDVFSDAQVLRPTFASGGSRALQRGLVTVPQLLRASAVCAGIVVVLSAWAAWTGRPGLGAVSMGMLIGGYAYSGGPFVLGRRLLGELDAAVVMGVGLPLAGGLAAGGVNVEVLRLLPLFFALTLFARLTTAWPDIAADRATGKWTVPALLGPQRSGWAFFVVAVAVAAASVVAEGVRGPALAAAGVVAGVAAWVGSGRGERRPEIVPGLGLLAYAAVLGAVLIRAWGQATPG